MSIFSSSLGIAVVLAALYPGGRTAHAQAGPMTSYWIPSGLIGFGGTATDGESSNNYNFAGFDGRNARGGASYLRRNFPDGWFMGSEGGRMALGMNGINQVGAFGNIGSLDYQRVQFGYNFKNAPVSLYGGIDTLKYNNAGSPFAAFDSTATLPGYTAQAGVEFQATPNVSLSLGFSYTQQPERIDSPALLGASPFGRR